MYCDTSFSNNKAIVTHPPFPLQCVLTGNVLAIPTGLFYVNFAESPECGDPEKPIYGIVEVRGDQGGRVGVAEARAAVGWAGPSLDKEQHYQLASALQKSIRGGADSAALYWLARALRAGEDPVFLARRLVRCASENVGLGGQRGAASGRGRHAGDAAVGPA